MEPTAFPGPRRGSFPRTQPYHRANLTRFWTDPGPPPFTVNAVFFFLIACHPEVPPITPTTAELREASLTPQTQSLPRGTLPGRLRHSPDGAARRARPPVTPPQAARCRTPPPASPPRGRALRLSPRGGGSAVRGVQPPASRRAPAAAAPAGQQPEVASPAGAFPPCRLTWHGGSRRRAEALPGRCRWGGERSAVPYRRRKSLRGPAPRAAAFMGCGPGPACQSAPPGRAPGSPLRGGDTTSSPPPRPRRPLPSGRPALAYLRGHAGPGPSPAPPRHPPDRPPRAVREAERAAGASPRGAERRGGAGRGGRERPSWPWLARGFAGGRGRAARCGRAPGRRRQAPAAGLRARPAPAPPGPPEPGTRGRHRARHRPLRPGPAGGFAAESSGPPLRQNSAFPRTESSRCYAF